MSKKKKRVKTKELDEFRKLRNREYQGHPTYVYSKAGDVYKFIGITHAPITKGIKNIPLSKNPNPTDIKKSFLRNKAESEYCEKFGGQLKNWKMLDNDKKQAKIIIDKGNVNNKKDKKRKDG